MSKSDKHWRKTMKDFRKLSAKANAKLDALAHDNARRLGGDRDESVVEFANKLNAARAALSAGAIWAQERLESR